MTSPLLALLDRGSRFLVTQGFEPDDARRDAERLALKSLGINRLEMYKTPSFIDESMERDFLSLLEKRADHIPLQYLEEEVKFMDFSFRVTPDVLIPRPETENLVERVLTEFPLTHSLSPNGGEGRVRRRILDIGTGSGVILLSLLKYFPESSGVGSDISRKALQVARENAGKLNVLARADFRESNVFRAFENEQFDLIVSNPPYIAQADWNGLSAEVKNEPAEALIAGPRGTEIYEVIIRQAGKFLSPGGVLFFEVGWNQAEIVSGLLQSAGFSVRVFRDDFGINRIIKSEILNPKIETKDKF